MIDFTPYLPPSRGGRSHRWSSAAEAIAAIPEGARIFIGGGALVPTVLLQELADQRDRYTRLEVVTAGLTKRPAILEHPGRPFWFVTTHATPAFRRLWDTGTVDILPARYSDLARIFADDGPLPADVAIVQTSAPGPDGRVSLGPSVGVNAHVVRTAPLVIAQVNPKVPYTFGAGELSTDEIDHLVRAEADIPVRRVAEDGDDGDPLAREVARLAAQFVRDDSTIQFGVGTIPDAILSNLSERRGLRVHSGLISEACIDLYEAGVIEGTMVSAEVLTTPRLLAWMDRNPAVEMGPASYTHGAGVIAAQRNFVALLSTVEVALDGACNSERVGGRIISGPGGAPDFAFGASLCTGGRSIVALPSTAAEGRISRIVRSIEPPNPTTMPAYVADIVVTEHGAAEVRSLPRRPRAERLRDLAHPEHRAALAPEA